MRLRWGSVLGLAACLMALIAGVAVTLRQMAAEPVSAGAPAPPSGPPEVQAVRVEHEFITLAEEAPLENVSRPMKSSAVRAVQPARRSVSEPRTLVGKTRRALLGDGRNRPEPFPRVDRNP